MTTVHPTTHYEHLARLFDYPGPDYPAWVGATRAVLVGRCPAAEMALTAFARLLPGRGDRLDGEALDALQELFTRTFDVQAVTTLSVGYVLFGDDYKRGELLVELSREQEAAGVPCGGELPDHLPAVLRLMARWADRALAAEFAAEMLHPAVERMIAEFGPDRGARRNAMYEKHYRTLIAGADRATMFREPLAAVRAVLMRDFALAEWRPPERANDFLRSLGRELELEADEDRPARTGGPR